MDKMLPNGMKIRRSLFYSMIYVFSDNDEKTIHISKSGGSFALTGWKWDKVFSTE